MNALTVTLIIKILFTLILWSGPLLLLSSENFIQLGFPVMMPDIYLKLLGWAYLTLVVAYCIGLRDAIKGIVPLSTIWIGIISNGGASFLLLIYGLWGAWNTWGSLAQTFMWGSMIVTGVITLALIWFGLIKQTIEVAKSNESVSS